MVTTDPASVDLVLVTAGLNDVNFRNVISPLKKPVDFAGLVRQRCHRDLRTLLSADGDQVPERDDRRDELLPDRLRQQRGRAD